MRISSAQGQYGGATPAGHSHGHAHGHGHGHSHGSHRQSIHSPQLGLGLSATGAVVGPGLSSPPSTARYEELLAQREELEALKRENEALRRRIKELEVERRSSGSAGGGGGGGSAASAVPRSSAANPSTTAPGNHGA